jgi:type IV pilus assembly protein PilP
MSRFMRTSDARGLRPWTRLALAGVLGLAMAGCSNDMSDLKEFVAKAESAPKTPIPKLPEIKAHETFRYEDSALRDPFAVISFAQPKHRARAGSGTGPRPIRNRPKEPLEAFPLDSLRMVGTLEQAGVTWALISAPDGTIHRVTTGNYMGQNDGKIIRITDTKVELTEIVEDGLGPDDSGNVNYIERPASVALQE